MEEIAGSFTPLLIVISLAFLVPLLLTRFERLRLPIVVGEILAGIVIGSSGFGWVTHEDQLLTLLAEFGFVFLMFLAGMEIDFANLNIELPGVARAGGTRTDLPSSQERERRTFGPLSISLMGFILTLSLSAIVGFALLRIGLVSSPWMMALIMSTTSLGVVMPVLKEQELIRGRFGQTILIAALVADFATMILITVVIATISHGLTLDILLISLLFVVFFLLYRLGIVSLNRFDSLRRTLEDLSHTTARIKIRGAFTVMLLFVVLAEVLGAEIILGAFIAGAMLSLLSTREDLEAMHQLEAVGFGFFIPIFFIMVGVNFNLGALIGSTDALILLPFLVLAAFLVKLLPALLFRLQFSWRETFSAGFLLSSRLSLIVAASAIGLNLGIISESVNTMIILVAIVTVTAAPLIFNRIVPHTAETTQRPMVVFGAERIGLQVAEQLLGHHEQVVLVDADESLIARARRRTSEGIEVLHASIDDEEEELAGHLDLAETVVVTLSDTDRNRHVCHVARTRYGIDHIVTLVRETNRLVEFETLNVTVFNPSLDQAALLSLLARNPDIYELLTRTDDNKEVSEVLLHNHDYGDKALRELQLPGDVLILSIRRAGEFIVPRGNTQLEYGDHLTLVGTFDHLHEARALFG
ncbi:MAG: monovalent cation:proton antiporter family protein [Caldilineaceae bacterium]|nr:monovalent cation:proton antiporter family protein [Caldilineaceae bacterium]MDE0339580.1 monovalent cation:proton antiporter family protein [Caldilineaceae bacterium]